MKKHILQENYERMFGSIKEDWWDDMDASAQAQYIKAHPGSNKAQQADDDGGDEDDYDMGAVPGSRELDDTPEDDSEKGSSLTSAPGRVPDEDEYPDKDPINTKKGELEDEMEDIANELDNVTDPDEKKELVDRYDEIDQELYDINTKQYGDDSGYEMSPADDEEPSGEKKPIPAKDLANDPNADTGPDSRGIAWSGDYSGAEDSAEWEEQYRETEEWADEYPEDAEKLAQIKWFGEKQGWGDRGELSSSARTGNELNQETLTINGKQYRRLTEGKINSKFIKYRIYDKISDEINKVELDDFNLRDFNSLKKPLIQFIHREIKRDKKISSGDLRQAIDKSDFDDEIFGRRGVIDDWYKESKKDFATFMKKYTTYSDNPKKGWKNYNASSLTYGIGKRLYKIVDSLLDEINNIVPESVHAFAEFYQRFKK